MHFKGILNSSLVCCEDYIIYSGLCENERGQDHKAEPIIVRYEGCEKLEPGTYGDGIMSQG